jgi:quinolinate synthase
MNQITLEDTLESLRQERRDQVPGEIRVRAARAVERMIAIGRWARSTDGGVPPGPTS